MQNLNEVSEKNTGGKEETPPKVEITPKKSEKDLKVGDTDRLGFKVLNINKNEKLGTEFYSYVFKNNGEKYFVEHTSYEGKDEGWKFSESIEDGAQYLRGKFDTEQEILDVIREDIEKKKIAEIVELLKTEKVSQVVFHSRDQEDPGKDEKGEDKGLKIIPDNDARLANYIFNNLNKKPPEEIYEEGAMSSFIAKSGTKENLSIQNKGLRIFIDAGGKWLSVEKDGKEIINLYIDHHGSGKRNPTSASEMMLKIMEKADLLKEKPEWLDSMVECTTKIDNLSYVNEMEENKKGSWNLDYFKKEWPNTIYAIAEKMPFDTLLKLFEEKKITDPSKVFTKEDLEGKLGKTKTETTLKWFLLAKQQPSAEVMENLVKLGKIDNVDHKFTNEEKYGALGETKIEITIAELCKAQKQRANEASFGVEEAERYMKERKLNFKNTALGKVLFHNHFIKKYFEDGNPLENKIHNDMAYLAARAHGYDTLVNLDNKNKKFFVNSWISVRKIADKFGLVDVRGNFIFGNTINEKGEVVVGEKELLDTIDPKILEKAVERKEPKKPLAPEEKLEKIKKKDVSTLTPEEKKLLLEYALKKREELNKKIEDKKSEILNLINEKDTKTREVEKKYERHASDDMSGFDEIPEPIEIEEKPVEPSAVAEQPENKEEASGVEDKRTEIEKRRKEELSATIVDESEVEKMVNRMLGEEEENEANKIRQIRYTFEENLVNGLANGAITQVMNETTGKRKRSSLRESIYWLQDMTQYVTVIEKGKELGLINDDKYKSLIGKFQKAKSIVEKEVNEYINKINARYDRELAELERASEKN